MIGFVAHVADGRNGDDEVLADKESLAGRHDLQSDLYS